MNKTKKGKIDPEAIKKEEIARIMLMPEVFDDLIHKSNPNQYDLYQCAFGEGGDLAVYADVIRTKMIQIKEKEIKQFSIVA